ncbi:MAG: molybdenum cofactor biosynthesis protein, partial [Alphaproteobacteria bacterium]|nr:molybdenum cofactor biosynthesis protein [Alphaproteobacteria bacterium]
MNRIDDSKPFKPVNIAVLTVSDTRTLETDKSGDTLVERIARDGHVLVDRAIVTDDVDKIRAQVQKWIDDPRIEAVIATGGTGVTGRDVTPEALEGLFEKRIDGFGEVFRWISFQKIGTSTMQSRAT